MLSVTELSALMSAQLKKGVFTNSAMTAVEYLEDDPELEVCVEDGALLILRHRDGFRLLNYYVQQDCESIEIPAFCDGLPVVCETAFKPRDEEAAIRTMELFRRCGFDETLNRIRLGRKEPGNAADDESKRTVPNDSDESKRTVPNDSIREFLCELFDGMTGCIPPEHLVAKGEYVWTERDGRIRGVLHFSVGRRFWEIRHLAVAEELRGSGAAAKLLEEAQAAAGNLPCRVWTGAENKAAIKFYEKHGFTADAYKSTVLIRK